MPETPEAARHLPPVPVASDDEIATARALGAAHEAAVLALIDTHPEGRPHRDYVIRSAYRDGIIDARRARAAARHREPTA